MAKNQRKEKPDLRKELAERLMQQMENGSAFWQRPWAAGEMEMPHNAVTGKPYRGVNAQNLLMFSPNPADNRWCTYKQAQQAGWQVKQGEHGTPIEKWSEYTHKRTDKEIQTLRAEGAKDPIELEEKRLGVRYYTVFHASQIDGIPERERAPEIPERNNAVDPRLPGLSKAMGVEVQHSGSRAFYRPGQDRVKLPPIENFQTGRDHDTIFLHELSHSTGHENRLNRDLSGKFGSQKYAKEELRAELSAAMTALSLGIGFSPESQQKEEGREVVAGVENTAAYLNSWLRGLPEKDRQKELMSAISESQKISDYLMERTPEIEKKAEVTLDEARVMEPEKTQGFHVGDFVTTHENRFGADWNTHSILVGLDDQQVKLQNLYRSGQEWKVSPGIHTMPIERFGQTVRHQVSGVVPPVIASAENGGHSIARIERIEKAVNAFHAEYNLNYGKTPPTPERVPDSVSHFLGDRQALATNQLLRDREAKTFYADKMQELNNIIMDMPQSYETDGKSDAEKVAALRYFGPGNAQFFIIEKDRGDPENEGTGFPRQQQAFGLADLGMGSPELGYINLEEITRNGAELDYHFTPTTLLEIKKEHYQELIRPIEKEAALESVRDFYEYLPDRVQDLMDTIKDRHEELSPVDFDGHRKVRVDFQAGVDDVLGIILEGPDKGANKNWLTLEKAGFTQDEIGKMPLMDDVQNATRRHGQNLSAFSKELDNQFTENLKAHGKERLKNPENLSKSEMGQAVFWKHGIQVEGTDNLMLNRFIDAVDNKDLPKLLSSIGHNSQNPASQEIFERLTGETLGKTQKARVETLEKWAGSEVVQAMKTEQAEKAAARAIEKPIKNLQNRYAGLQEVLVRTQDSQKGEIVLNGQEYLSHSVEKGFTDTFARPKGAVMEYGLLNKEEGIYRTVKDTRISQFAKAVREVNPDGKILPALEKAGITLTKEKTLQGKVSERAKAKGLSL